MFAPAEDTWTDVPASQLIQTDCFHDLPQPALAFDGGGQLVAFNAAAATLRGIRVNETDGLCCGLFFPLEAAYPLARAIATVWSQGEWRGALSVVMADGATRTAMFGMVQIGDRIIATYSDPTEHEPNRSERREVVRWEAVRRNVVAFTLEMARPLPPWVVQAARFTERADEAFDSVIDQGAGRTVLLVGFGPVMQQILTAFLERCQYVAVGVDYPSQVLDTLKRHVDRVRTAVLGPNATPDTISELHRLRPLLPVVTVGWDSSADWDLPLTVEPSDFVRAVAESIAIDHLNDGGAGYGFDYPDFTIS